MVIGVCKIDLFLSSCVTLKEKRQIIKSLKERIKNRFEVSIAEVDSLNLKQRAVLGMAYVSNDSRHANEVISKAVNYTEKESSLEIIDYSFELLNF